MFLNLNFEKWLFSFLWLMCFIIADEIIIVGNSPESNDETETRQEESNTVLSPPSSSASNSDQRSRRKGGECLYLLTYTKLRLGPALHCFVWFQQGKRSAKAPRRTRWGQHFWSGCQEDRPGSSRPMSIFSWPSVALPTVWARRHNLPSRRVSWQRTKLRWTSTNQGVYLSFHVLHVHKILSDVDLKSMISHLTIQRLTIRS